MGGVTPLTPDQLQRALAGDRAAVRAFVDALTPPIQSRVARTLLRHRHAGRDIRQEVEDLCQHVFVALFADDARALRAWDPSRGLPLAAFVGMVAEREVSSVLRSQRRNPWTDKPTEEDGLDSPSLAEAGPEQLSASREALHEILARLRARLSERGMQMFLWLYVDEHSVEEVQALTGMTPDAVYAWKSRLGKQVRAIADEVMSDSAVAPRTDQVSP
jgi:RNA polymerase sigma-70 factor (ECF subfamily)